MERLEPLLSGLVAKGYVRQGLEGIASRHGLFRALLSSRELPERGWDDMSIELLLAELAAMDSNNFPHNVGAGEREGRVYSSIVARRHFRLSHGIGRSGDIAEVQPKGAGSSIIAKITLHLLLSALKVCGLTHIKAALILPLATGMSLMMCMSALKSNRPQGKYVIWPRIDQKSCFKSILSANLVPLIVENVIINGELETDLTSIEELIRRYGDEILCVLSTTSCFAPRNPDKIDFIAALCRENGIPHVVNNAYGVQCRSLSKLINRAMTVGRVDFIVSSLDKNFMVPVGGALVGSGSQEPIALVSKSYPGRASIAPTLDLFITLLSMGKLGLQRLLTQREQVFQRLREGLEGLAAAWDERVLPSSRNPISVALSLSQKGGSPAEVAFLGSMLFQRCVSGARVVPVGHASSVGGFAFKGWGAHHEAYPHAYLTAAGAIGMTEEEVDLFLEKLTKALRAYHRRAEGRDQDTEAMGEES